MLILVFSPLTNCSHYLYLYSQSIVLCTQSIIYICVRNANNIPSNTHFLTHSLRFVKIHMGPTKSCGSHLYLVGPMQILTNQRECVGKYVLQGVLLAFLYLY